MAPYSRKRANPFSACRLVMAAVRVVCSWLEQLRMIVEWSYFAVVNVTNCTYHPLKLLCLKPR